MKHLSIIEKFVTPQDSIIDRIIEAERQPGEANIYCHVCIPNTDILGEKRQKWIKLLIGAGAGYNQEASTQAALGESLERYSAVASTIHLCDNDLLPIARCQELPEAAPWRYNLFSEEQYKSPDFPYIPLHEDSLLAWAPAQNETQQSKTFVPAALALFPHIRKSQETRILYSLSTGLALGNSRNEAILKGLYEVIERDALALAWNWNLPVKKIGDCDYTRNLRDQVALEAECVSHFFYITQDITIPTVVAFLCRKQPQGDYRVTVGSAARFSLEEALSKAFLEALQGIPYIRGLHHQFADWTEVKSYNEVKSFQHSAIFYSKFSHLIADKIETGNLLNVAGEIHLDKTSQSQKTSVDEQLQQCIQKLSQHNYELLSCDLSLEELRQQELHVYRAVVPGLLGLEGSYQYRFRDTTRVQQAAERLQVTYSANELPHPLP